MMKLISRETIDSCCSPGEAVEAMRLAFGHLSNRQANVPLRTPLLVNEQTTSLVMPVAIKGYPTFAIKSVSLTRDNHLRNLPRINGTLTLFDSKTGCPVCQIDAERITSLRTGAAVGLSVDLFTPPEPLTLGLFGCGNQASACLRAIASTRPLQQVFVFSRDPNRGSAFCQNESRFTQAPIIWTREQATLKQCQVVCLATSSPVPVFEQRQLPDQFLLAAIGSYQADQTEFDPKILESAQVIVDQKTACVNESGEICTAIENGYLDPAQLVEIGQLINQPEISRSFSRTVFKSVGNAVQDLVLGDLVYQKARSLEPGQENNPGPKTA
ncbi:MAG: ornithine cyclodeaminase family protein [Planctomycetota bacterium]|nr:ornithine cyclodeaminase family protein [Planctomycetota bacterium]